MKICPKCGKVLSYNSYFGAYICSNCNWEDSLNRTKKGNRRCVPFSQHSNSQNRSKRMIVKSISCVIK